jgi:hypothetical protein
MAVRLVVAPDAELDIAKPMSGMKLAGWAWARSSLVRSMRVSSESAANR